MCSKKDYEAIAKILRKERGRMLDPLCREQMNEALDEIAGQIADHFQHNSPNFDADRFLEAATVD